jgi:hypothetical protein
LRLHNSKTRRLADHTYTFAGVNCDVQRGQREAATAIAEAQKGQSLVFGAAARYARRFFTIIQKQQMIDCPIPTLVQSRQCLFPC